MTERELLEAAAKAIGLRAEWIEPESRGQGLHLPGARCFWWNPLTDGGDRLHLVRKLGFTLDFSNRHTHAVHFCLDDRAPAQRFEWEAGNEEAEGLAVVRAAAQMGHVGQGAFARCVERRSLPAGSSVSNALAPLRG